MMIQIFSIHDTYNEINFWSNHLRSPQEKVA